jgi:hypothetical protein
MTARRTAMETTDGADQSQWLNLADNQSTSEFPRSIIEHIGQVLRNRYRGDLLIALPSEMLKLLQMPNQSTSTSFKRQH